MEYLVYLAVFFVLFATLASRDFLLAFTVFSGLLPAYVLRFNIGPLPSTALEGMFWVLLAAYVWRQGCKRTEWRGAFRYWHSTSFFYPGLLLLAASLVASFVSPDLRAALGIWRAYFVEPFLVYLLAVHVLRDDRAWRQVFVALGCTTIVLSAFAFYQYITGHFLPTWEWTATETRRATSLFTSPNALALFVVPVSMVALALVLELRTKAAAVRAQLFWLAVLASAFVSLLVGRSKGGIAAFGVGALFILWHAWDKRRTAFLAAMAIAALLIIPAVRYSLIANLQFATPSGQSRLALYAGSLKLLQQSPILGMGLAHFGEAFEQVRPADYTEKLIYPHNIALNFWLETGLLGLLSVAWIAAKIMSLFWRKANRSPALIGLTAAFLAILIHGLVDVPYFKNDLAMLTWLLLAALAVLLTASQSASSQTNQA